MNIKEQELITEEFLHQPNVLNRQLGGSCSWCTKNSVVVFINNKWRRIRKELYDPKIHMTPTTGTIRVFDMEKKVYRRIPSVVYQNNKANFLTASSGRVTVLDLITKAHKSILITDFDKNIHRKVLGGIVAEINGIRQYVDKQTFNAQQLKGVHVGKSTMFDNVEHRIRHVTKEEYLCDKGRFVHVSTGKITVTVISTNQTCKISSEEYYANKDKYMATTTGQKTVWDINTKQFRNIKKEEFNRQLHRLASDKKIRCVGVTGDLLIDFWGTKIDFVKEYGIEIYNQAINETKNYQPKQLNKFKLYQHSSFELINWRS